MTLRPWSAPIFLQVFAVVLAAVIAAQAVNVLVLIATPDPPPTGFTVAEAARALKGEEVRLADGGRLATRALAAAPDWRPGIHRPMERALEESLGRALGRPAADVRVRIQPPRGEQIHRRLELRTEAHPGHPPHARIREETVTMQAFRHHGPGPPPRDFVLGAENLLFPPFSAAVRMADGGWRLVEPPHRLLSPWRHRLMLSLLLAAALSAPLAWLLARRLTRPVRAFAEAADRLGADPNAPPLKPAGPSEVRTAIGAFNDMQEKLRAYVEGRTTMLAAIAHDLRTPLTRLRFHAEAAPDKVRDRMAADIADMDAMIGSILAFARSGRAGGERRAVDLASLVAAVVDNFAETGAPVRLVRADAVTVRGDPLALKRMLANLVENAVKFAGAAEVSLAVEDGDAVITVADRGPGLSPEDLELVFEPFRRAEPSRSRDTGGAGLGLATARAIARDHRGDVTLTARKGGGLEAIARLQAGA